MHSVVPDFARESRGFVCIGATTYFAGEHKINVLESRGDQGRQANVEIRSDCVRQCPKTRKERLASATVGEVEEHGRFERSKAGGTDYSHSAGVIAEARPLWVRDEVGKVLWEGV